MQLHHYSRTMSLYGHGRIHITISDTYQRSRTLLEKEDSKDKDDVDRTSDRVAAVVAYFPPVDLREWVGDKRYPALDFDHRHAAGRVLLGIDDDAAVHFLIGNFNPLAADPHFGPLIGRAVERFGEGAVHVGIDEPAILRRSADRAVVGNLGQNLIE